MVVINAPYSPEHIELHKMLRNTVRLPALPVEEIKRYNHYLLYIIPLSSTIPVEYYTFKVQLTDKRETNMDCPTYVVQLLQPDRGYMNNKANYYSVLEKIKDLPYSYQPLLEGGYDISWFFRNILEGSSED